jgi:hypothetical protein
MAIMYNAPHYIKMFQALQLLDLVSNFCRYYSQSMAVPCLAAGIVVECCVLRADVPTIDTDVSSSNIPAIEGCEAAVERFLPSTVQQLLV